MLMSRRKMEENEQPNKTVPQGNEPDKPVTDDEKDVETIEEPSSLFDKTNRVVERLEAANKKTEDLLNRQERIYMNQRLGGTAGGNVPVKKVDLDQEMADKLLADSE